VAEFSPSFRKVQQRAPLFAKPKADAAENGLPVRQGFRILSAYKTRKGAKLWVITEAARSATRILLPDGY
jgi:hypothetical protein